ncbi:MAG: hypothetical protein IKO78_04620 [Bacilli bacterium]|nr:hypothetical protein [Bacilli bacterium]
MKKEDYLKLPIYKNQKGKYLVKQDIVNNFPHNFNIKDNGNYEYATTSGTTSDRMEIIRKPNWWQDEYKRTYSNDEKLNKCFNEKLHKIIFTTAQCSNLVCFVEKPSMEKRTIGNTLYVNNTFNPWDWTKDNINEIVNEINLFKPYYLDADPVYLSIFLYLKDKYKIKTKLHVPEIITLSYEFVTKNTRDYISKKLKTDIRNLYGTTEFGYAFLENKDGKMAVCKDLLDVDLLPVNKKNHIYSLIIDSYKNEYMPLINYKVGDLVEATDEEVKNFKKDKVVTRMAGREKDVLDEKISFSMLDNLINKVSDRILLYQFYFINKDICSLKYITLDNKELSEKEKKEIIKELKEIDINYDITFNLVEEISPEMSGKFTIVKRQI